MNAEQALELSVALTELQKYIEDRFPPGPPSRTYLSPTGEPFIILAPCPLDEGERCPIFPTFSEAISEARRRFDIYAEGRSGQVYWRIKPEADLYHGPDDHGWRFYMRLLISDKPLQPKED